MGTFLRRGPAEIPVQTVDVIISGDTNANHAYVKIDGTDYTTTGTYAIPAGASITVYCYYGYTTPTPVERSAIAFNGAVVAQATSERRMLNYSFQLETQTSIVFSIVKRFMTQKNYKCDITTS